MAELGRPVREIARRLLLKDVDIRDRVVAGAPRIATVRRLFQKEDYYAVGNGKGITSKGWRTEVIRDLGSATNYRKKGLRSLLKRSAT